MRGEKKRHHQLSNDIQKCEKSIFKCQLQSLFHRRRFFFVFVMKDSYSDNVGNIFLWN